MATYIYRGATTVTPELVTGWQTASESQNVIHEILSKSTPDVTLKTALTRSGTLEFLFTNETDATACLDLHVTPGVITLVSTEITAANFQYVTAGNISVSLDETTRKEWTVEVDFRAIT